MNFSDFFTALALVLIIESMGPFVSPGGARRLYHLASQVPERQLRLLGLVGMIAGLVLLTIVRR